MSCGITRTNSISSMMPTRRSSEREPSLRISRSSTRISKRLQEKSALYPVPNSQKKIRFTKPHLISLPRPNQYTMTPANPSATIQKSSPPPASAIAPSTAANTCSSPIRSFSLKRSSTNQSRKMTASQQALSSS
jgi:hypothetical protein